VLATSGGGEDGRQLLEAFIKASRNAPWQAVAVAGPMTPDEVYKSLQAQAAKSNVTLLRFVPRLSALFDSIDALVCMGGYNTLAEAVSQGIPTVCVPRTEPRTEQLIRALAFERLGLLETIRPQKNIAQPLRVAIERALTGDSRQLRKRAHAAINFNGAQRTAEILVALADQKESATKRQPVS
jgi:predicted glycosyltransferase